METLTLEIAVNDTDIICGTPDDCSACPVALATERAATAAGIAVDFVDVSHQLIDIHEKSGRHWGCNQSKTITTFIDTFDGRGPDAVLPFTETVIFTLVKDRQEVANENPDQ